MKSINGRIGTLGLWAILVAALATPFVGAEGMCGAGPVYSGDEIVYANPISFTVQVTETTGYFIDCTARADAFVEDRGPEGGGYKYAIWGQMGDFQ